MEEKVRRICCVNTVYCLFLYLLICGIDDEDIFIFDSNIPEHIRNKLNHIFFPDIIYKGYHELNLIQKIKKRVINISKRIYIILKIRFLIKHRTRNREVKVYGQGHLDYSFPLYEFDDTYLLEDGLSNYTLDIKKPTYNNTLIVRIKKFFGFYILDDSNFWLGSHDKIKKVYLTQDNIPYIIKDKTELINIKKLWDQKSEFEKNKILDIYEVKDVINNLDDNIILLLTQCISDEDLLPLDEEIEMYRYLINKQKTKNIVIKTHPREKKDYHTIFPNMTIIDKPFSLELFKCMDLNIDKIITVASTASLNFLGECEIEIYDRQTSSQFINECIDKLKKMSVS